MSHRTHRASLKVCLALALWVAPTAARAIDLTGVTSAILTWTAASGPVAGYGVFIARNGAGFPSTPNFTIATTSATVTGSYGDSLMVRVAAYTSSGTYGPASPDSDVIRFISPTPSIAVSATTLSASSQAGTNPPSGSFTVRNATGGTLTYTVTDNQGWLSASPGTGTSTGENDPITVSYDTTGLPAGSYTGTLTVDGGSGVTAKTVSVSLVVTAPPASAAIALSTSSLATSVTEGSSPGSQTFTIRNSGGGTLSYCVTDDQSWLSVSPAGGTSTGESDTVTITYAAASLAPGSYSAVVTASASGATSRTIAVSLTVNAATAQPTIQLSTGAITASTALGLNASPQTFTVRNSGGGTLSYSVNDDQSWLSVSPSIGTSTGESDAISVSFTTSSLASGTYTAAITASATGVATQSVAVTLTVSSVNGGAGRAILVGVGEGGSGAVEVLGATASFAWSRTLSVDWSSYNASVGETRPAACDVDGDGNSEYVIGLGTGSSGRLEVLQDGPGGYVHLAWLQVTLSAYDAANGETFPACGDLDGDGKDEIVVGLGSGGGGKLQVFDDASTGYAVMSGTPVAGGILQVDYTAYNNANGETHPAVGDFDGDGRDEIAVGLGDGGVGWIALFEDKNAGFAPMDGTPTAGGWLQIGWASYHSANGSTYPAAGNIDGDAPDELVIGLGSGGQGYVRVTDDKLAGFAQIGSGWLQLDSPAYNASNGATYPTVGNLDGDDREEILVGRSAGGAGQMKAWDDTVAGFAALPGTSGGWITVSQPSVSAGGGATRPTIGNGASATPPPPPAVPAITLSVSSLSTSASQGGNASSRTFTVRNAGTGTLSYAASDDQTWMSVSPASGTSTGESDTITVSFSSSGLSPATRTGSIVVSGGSGVPSQTVTVSLAVTAPSTSSGGAGVAAFSAQSGQWVFKNASADSLETSLKYGGKGFVPVYGDWNGDGVATLGAYQTSTGTWYLRNGAGAGNADLVFKFGPAGALPVVGDWNGDGRDTIGAFVPATAQWSLRNTNSAGNPDLSFAYGFPGVLPVAGDWNNDGVDTIGIYYPPTGAWYLRNAPGAGNADLQFTFGYGGTQPVVGDWNNDGVEGIGIFDPASGTWLLREVASAGAPNRVIQSNRARGATAVAIPNGGAELPPASPAQAGMGSGDQLALFDPPSGQWMLQYGITEGSAIGSVSYGSGGTFVPVHGDWNGDGVATLGVFQTSTATWYLRNGPGAGAADVIFAFGPGGAIPVVGDWNADGRDSIGVYVPSTSQWYLRNTNSGGAPDWSFVYGFPGVSPVAGDWNGDGRDTIGIYFPATGGWYLRNQAGGGNPDWTFSFGYPGTKPVIGDWDGNGLDGIGLYDPRAGRFILRNSPNSGAPDLNTSVGDMAGGMPVIWKP